jgi:serine phosphatase RsbU (regulator of sigma subunit)
MGPQEGYLQRLAELDAAVAKAQLAPELLLERAAGLLAGRTGCRVDEAHAHLLLLAAEQDRDPRDVAAETLTALEGQAPTSGNRVRAAVNQVLRLPHRDATRPRRLRPAAEPGDGWATTVQQTLDGLPGEHALLLPVRDAAGVAGDFVIAAASPAASDVGGQHGAELIGVQARQAYPSSVDGPVWRMWQDVLADGVAREVGPLPLPGPTGGEPSPATVMVRVRSVGRGLLTSWERLDDPARLGERIARTERLGNLGWGEWDLVADTVVWSDELYRIYERSPADGPMPREESEALTLPEDDPIRRQAAEAFGRGETVDVTTRIRIGGRIKHIRSVIDAERDAVGRPLKVYGIVQDVTVRETARAKLAEVQAQLREHQQSLAAEHRLAGQLQNIILPIPEGPVDLPGLRVAVRYLAAEQANRVGGDWFLATTADDGSVVLAVGDVAGHGIHAAATMAQLRHALATMVVTTTTDPAVLLSHLNRLLCTKHAPVGLATAVVARFDPITATLTWSLAGHPAPLRTRRGATTVLDEPHGTMLGAVRNPTYRNATIAVDGHDLLLFFTDGLIEDRHHALDEGLVPVVDTLNRVSTGTGPRSLPDLLAQLRRANPDDDTCMLAAHPLPAPVTPSAVSGDPRS